MRQSGDGIGNDDEVGTRHEIDDEKDAEVAKWSQILKPAHWHHCRRHLRLGQYFRILPDGTEKKSGIPEEISGRLTRLRLEHRRRLWLLDAECIAWHDVEKLENKILRDGQPGQDKGDNRSENEKRDDLEEDLQRRFPNEEQFFNRIADLDAAKRFYRKLWMACDRDEKLLLYQMASGDLINAMNRVAIQSLESRGLIMRDPDFAIVNRSFSRFVLNAEPIEQIAAWRAELPKGSWADLRTPLLIILALMLVFFFYVSPTAFGQVMALGTALTGAIPIVLRYLPMLRSGRTKN